MFKEESDPVKDMGIGSKIYDKEGREYNFDEVAAEWADFYKISVEDPEYGEPSIVTDEKGYNEFGRWMATFLLDISPNCGYVTPNGTEDRLFYRTYGCVKHMYKWNKLSPGLDEDTMAGYILDWFRLGLVDVRVVMSVLFYAQPSDNKFNNKDMIGRIYDDWDGKKWNRIKYKK